MEYKAYALMAILLSSVAAVGMLGTAHAQTGLTVAAENTADNTVTISGNVGTVVEKQPVLIRVTNPEGAAYRIDQVDDEDIAADGSYSYEMKVGGKLGPNGEYNVKVTYNGVTRETTFNFTGGEESGWEEIAMVVTAVDGTTDEHDIQYKIEGGSLEELTGDQATSTITAIISGDSNGNLTIRLPRDIIDSKDGDADAEYVVFVDEQDGTFEDDEGADVRTLTIDFEEGAEQIDIVGTEMIPEFGAIAAIVLAVAIVGIIVATTRSGKFSFLPKM